ncbi:hypothetical protein IDJ77_20385 [Mucilaginibacter sp. ZT4R22]|uniref:Uncharacterized protein n=1 Tax=Mucilaginibacter pankratovii TaxID=2772110 RepID=A0ABR7WV63_9SPHI|nr:hypothetical protein [Mucilaginibacter pankratovii]MBD1366181.1 hypothetical protein [Mucilaginibacter pankratovii]
MKAFILTVFLSLAVSTLFAQTACSKFKYGTFKMAYGKFNLIIKRAGKYQFEEMQDPKISVSYMVKWIDGCHYQLKPNEDYFKQFPQAPKNALITVEITSVKKNSYTLAAKYNFSEEVVTGEAFKID